MYNYKLIVQYDGTDYAGWQVQDNAVTIQQKIIDSIEVITKEKVNLIGSGRTDTGVHAFGQTANFKLEKELNIHKFKYSLNSLLPKDISIRTISEVNPDFHSRFDAVKRSYLYFISKDKSPFLYKFTYHFKGEINIQTLNKLSKCLMGEHDFTSFARMNTEIENKKCTIYDIHWRSNKEITTFFIEANRFLHGMVRTTVGTLLKASKENLSEDYFLDILDKKNREYAGEAVPAKGLFLYKVKY